MFFSYQSRPEPAPKQIIELEDIEPEEENNVVPNRPPPQQVNQPPANIYNEKKTKKHLNAAALMITSEKPKVKPEQRELPPDIATPSQQEEIPVKVSIQRPETDLKIPSPHKPKFQGRLLGNLTSLAPIANNILNSDKSIPTNVPERKRAFQPQNNIPQIDSTNGIQQIPAPRIPNRKIEQQAEMFQNQDMANLPEASHQKPRGRLLGSLL